MPIPQEKIRAVIDFHVSEIEAMLVSTYDNEGQIDVSKLRAHHDVIQAAEAVANYRKSAWAQAEAERLSRQRSEKPDDGYVDATPPDPFVL